MLERDVKALWMDIRCSGNEECPGTKPYCSQRAGGICVECYSKYHCPGNCACENFKCVCECEDNSDCPSERPYCSQRAGNKCVECWSDGHCPGSSNHCTDYKCEKECDKNVHCPPSKPYCSQGAGWKCVECWSDPHCKGEKTCEDYHCVGRECIGDEHCTDKKKPHCSQAAGYICVECWSKQHCLEKPGGGWVECRNYKCERECYDNSDCPSSNPYCSQKAGWKCVKCWNDDHCIGAQRCIDFYCTSACDDKSECKKGYRCKDGNCVKMECGTVANPKCPDPVKQWCDDGLCRDYVGGRCESWRDCADGYFCGETGCERSPCNDYTDCVAGLCCYQGECIACEDTGCYVQAQCPPGWYCDPDINKCRPRDCERHSDCEEGYHCDLAIGKCVALPTEEISLEDEEILSAHPCRVGHDTDCRRGEVCIGYPVHILKRILSPGAADGYCGEPDELLIRITGVDDEKTCDYCRSLIGNIWPQSKVSLPPYHEHCRCDYEFV